VLLPRKSPRGSAEFFRFSATNDLDRPNREWAPPRATTRGTPSRPHSRWNRNDAPLFPVRIPFQERLRQNQGPFGIMVSMGQSKKGPRKPVQTEERAIVAKARAANGESVKFFGLPTRWALDYVRPFAVFRGCRARRVAAAQGGGGREESPAKSSAVAKGAILKVRSSATPALWQVF